MALRGYYTSPLDKTPVIESHLDIRDKDGTVVPGYGWIFPLGDGRINVGVGLLTTDKRFKGVNTSKLMEAFVHSAPKSWGINEASSLGAPTGGKLPMALSIHPNVGPNILLAGDASGIINPFNGEGIAYAYETGRMAAASVGMALSGQGAAAIYGYATTLDMAYRSYYRVARGFLKVIGNPTIMRACVGTGLRSRFLMEELLRVMANLMRPEALGPAEMLYKSLDLAAHAVKALPMKSLPTTSL
jgi:flavin-dependent dehydrogenase